VRILRLQLRKDRIDALDVVGSTRRVTLLNVLLDAGEFMLRDPLHERVISDLVLHDVHEPSVEEESLADELKISKSDTIELAKLDVEAFPEGVSSRRTLEAERVGGMVDFAAHRKGAGSRQQILSEGLRIVDAVLVDVLEDHESSGLVDATDANFAPAAHVGDFAGLPTDPLELVASDEGEANKLGSVVDAAEESLLAVVVDVEDMSATESG
jgi:hypothetical protein